MSPWLVFALTCLGMAGVAAIIGLVWTEGFARLCMRHMRAADRRASAPRAAP